MNVIIIYVKSVKIKYILKRILFLYNLDSIYYFSLDNNHSNWVEWYFIVILIYISLIISDVKHTSMFTGHLKVSFWETSVWMISPFLIGFLIHLNKTYILDINALSDVELANIITHLPGSVDCFSWNAHVLGLCQRDSSILFIAPLFTITSIWNQPKCLPMNEWINKI